MAIETNLLPGQMLSHVADMARRQKGMPPVEKWNPEFCGDIDMVIRRDGSWHYMGTPILRPAMVRVFSTVLRRDEDGKYYLVTPVEKIGITVEDAPFLAVQMAVDGEGQSQALTFTTNLGDIVSAGPDHQLRIDINPQTEEVGPYVHVRGRLEAKLARPIYYDLVDLAVTHEIAGVPWLGVWSQGVFFPMIREDVLV